MNPLKLYFSDFPAVFNCLRFSMRYYKNSKMITTFSLYHERFLPAK